GAALYWLRDILTPLAMAIFLLIMIDGMTRFMSRRTPLPERAALPVSLFLIVMALAASTWVIVDGMAGFISQASTLGPRLDAVIADVARLLNIEVAPTAKELIGQINVGPYVGKVAGVAQQALSGFFFVLVYLGFLIASRRGFRKKIVALFPTKDDRGEALAVFTRIRDGVEGYLWVQTVTGLMIAVAAWILMAAVGLENGLFWAFVIFIVCYIPVIGGAVAGLAPPLFALVQFDSYGPAIILLIGLQLILFVVSNLIQPRMQGQNANIDAVVVLLALAFWGALWGVTGMFLSTPLAVMAMAILAEFPGSRWIAVLLSGDGEPYPEKRGGGAAAQTSASVQAPAKRTPPAKKT
ncbi:MAG TPA: AI-2E family transporter, partial [Caulobacteraceae bacterium]